jgi:adenine/guanine phosphoribosyltransferase-like PRPP-binding protein
MTNEVEPQQPLQEIIELETIRGRERLLRELFLQYATVKNYEKGYISVPFVNQLIDLPLQGYAADIIAYNIKQRELDIEKVIQIPYSGNSLATSVAERLRLPLVLGRKEFEKTPGSWEKPFIIKEEVKSFTTGAMSTFVFNELFPGDRVYLIDDVVANGDTASLIINELQKKDIQVQGIATYFAKLFQEGVNNIPQKTGIEPFYVIGIEEITEKEGIILSPPKF